MADTPFNPYAAPEVPIGEPDPAALEEGVWRDGDLMVLTRNAIPPELCVHCGLPGARWYGYQSYWHPSWVYFTLVFPPIYLVVAQFYQWKVEFAYSLCSEHARARSRRLFLYRGITIAGVVGLFLAPNLPTASLQLLWRVVALVVMLGGGVATGEYERRLKVAAVDRRFYWIRKVSPLFLEGLAPFRAEQPPGALL